MYIGPPFVANIYKLELCLHQKDMHALCQVFMMIDADRP